jgi:hypothetical protein
MTIPLVTKLKCLNPACSNEWVPRTEYLPKVCPACKNYHWNSADYWQAKLGGGKSVKVKKVHSSRRKETAIDKFRQQHKQST